VFSKRVGLVLMFLMLCVLIGVIINICMYMHDSQVKKEKEELQILIITYWILIVHLNSIYKPLVIIMVQLLLMVSWMMVRGQLLLMRILLSIWWVFYWFSHYY
jgi:hypothetical protein